MSRDNRKPMSIPAMRAQGWYYLVGGVWPFMHFRSFQAVVGPKPDRFQVEVTSGLFMAIGAALLATDRQNPRSVPLRGLAVSTAAGVMLVEWRNRRQLRPVFLGEGLLEGAFIASALASSVPALRRRRGLPPS
jgi:hypothetical protein